MLRDETLSSLIRPAQRYFQGQADTLTVQAAELLAKAHRYECDSRELDEIIAMQDPQIAWKRFDDWMLSRTKG